MPLPDLTSAVAVVLSAMVEVIVRLLDVSNSLTINCPPAVPSSVPPVIVVALLPTALEIKMPPVVTTLVPVSVSVLAAAPLKRMVLGVIAELGLMLVADEKFRSMFAPLSVAGALLAVV